MENASKALIIAGSVLIALMIIGALLLMFSNLSSYQEINQQGTRETQILEFNNQYETYNRKNVRGSDLYSLLNKVIDYNRRQSLEGTGWSDQGETISYEQMTITFTIDVKQLSADGTNRLFTKNIAESGNKYVINKNENKFENSIKSTIDNLENKYGSDSLVNLTTNLTRIFPENPSESQKRDAVSRFNNASKKIQVNSWDELKDSTKGTIRYEVYQYYEYMQFKRAYFDCIDTKYNEETGRIIEMDFEFTGKFN